MLARVGRIGAHRQLERPDGRLATLFPDDEIVVCYGHRYAPDVFEAEVPDNLGECHLVGAGGIAARVRSRHASSSVPTTITPLGLIAGADGERVRILRPGSTGVSAHASRQAAARHALLELLELDLAWRSWYGADTPPSRLHDPPLSPLLSRSLDQLGLIPTVLVLQGPANVGCIVACVHTAERREQSFGARCVLVDDDASLRHGIEAAVYEALMVRWSMTTPVARRAWRDMERTSPPTLPRDPLEHALWTFHRQDSLGHWLAQAVVDKGWAGSPAAQAGAGAGWRRLAHLLAEHTGSDVVAVDTTVPTVCSEGVTVVRVVAPGARRLPADERDAPSPQDPDASRSLPHPFG